MKVTLETYRKIQEYKKLGLSKRKTADHFGLSARTMDKLWNVTEDEFLNAEKTRFEYLDLYKEFMLEKVHLHDCFFNGHRFDREALTLDFKFFFLFIKKI